MLGRLAPRTLPPLAYRPMPTKSQSKVVHFVPDSVMVHASMGKMMHRIMMPVDVKQTTNQIHGHSQTILLDVKPAVKRHGQLSDLLELLNRLFDVQHQDCLQLCYEYVDGKWITLLSEEDYTAALRTLVGRQSKDFYLRLMPLPVMDFPNQTYQSEKDMVFVNEQSIQTPWTFLDSYEPHWKLLKQALEVTLRDTMRQKLVLWPSPEDLSDRVILAMRLMRSSADPVTLSESSTWQKSESADVFTQTDATCTPPFVYCSSDALFNSEDACTQTLSKETMHRAIMVDGWDLDPLSQMRELRTHRIYSIMSTQTEEGDTEIVDEIPNSGLVWQVSPLYKSSPFYVDTANQTSNCYDISASILNDILTSILSSHVASQTEYSTLDTATQMSDNHSTTDDWTEIKHTADAGSNTDVKEWTF